MRLLTRVGGSRFVAVTVVGMVVGAHDRDWMDGYATTLSSGVLAIILIAVLGYVAVKSPATTDWTKAVIPVVVIIGAMGMTQIYPTRARDNARPA